MSKYIPTDNKPSGQAKPKLKVKVVMNEKETFLNEYDAFQMISELKAENAQQSKLLQELGLAVTGILDGMRAGSSDVVIRNNTPPVQQSNAPQPTSLKLPKLTKVADKKETQGTLSGGAKFYGSSGEVKITQ